MGELKKRVSYPLLYLHTLYQQNKGVFLWIHFRYTEI